MAIEVLPASADRWADVERVMRTPGDPETCWCQVVVRRLVHLH